jgi:hypothetical protein
MRKPFKKTIFRIVATLLIAILAEVFLFNARSFELIGASERDLPIEFIWVADQTSTSDGKAQTVFHSPDSVYFPDELRNLQLDLPLVEGEKVKGSLLIEQDGLLSGTTQSFELIGGIPHSMTIALYPSKPVQGIQLKLEKSLQSPIRGKLNHALPIAFNSLRFGLLLLVLLAIQALMPGSALWLVPYNPAVGKQKAAFAFLALMQTVVLTASMVTTYPDFSDAVQKGNLRQEDYIFKQHYQLLTQALFQRSPSLLEAPPERLAQADNPYDSLQRIDQFPPYIWDTSYYDGKYYIYFGVVPALTFYMPYTLLLHRYPLNDFAVLFFAILGSLGLLGVFLRLIRRYFNRLPFLAVWLGSAILLMSVFLPWYVRRSFTYELALSSAFAFSVWGLYFLLLAGDFRKVQLLWLFCSGTSFALAVGCRPTSLLAILPALPLLSELLRDNHPGDAWKKKAGLKLAAFILPYALIGAGLAWYNQIRFGSLTEFGRTFQLSIQESDVYVNGSSIATFLIGVVNYIFGTGVQFTAVFPFLKANPPATFAFGGIKEYYPIFSALAITPTSLFLLFSGAYWSTIRKFGPVFRWFFLLLVFTSILLAGFTGVAVGTIQRYLLDFDWMLALAGLLAILAFLEGDDSVRNRKLVAGILMVGCMIGFFMQVPLSLGESFFGRSWLALMNPTFYDKIVYFWSFWM